MRFIDESDNWNLFKLGEVLDKKGYIRGPFGSALKRGEMKKEGIPVYEQQHAIYNNRIFRYYIDNDKFQELKRFQVFPNDLIVNCSGTIGKTSLITNNDEKGIISQALLILRSNSNIINPKFLKYFLETNSGYNSLISSAGGSSQVNIAKKQIILDIPLLIPNLETQSKIISFLDLINNKIELLEEKHKYYQDFKKYLMQKLFAQELRFKSADGEQYSDWKERNLYEFLTEHKLKSTGNEEVYSVSVHKGLVNQKEHLGRDFSAPDTSKYNLVKPGDIVYTKSPTGDFPLGIIKQSRVDKNVIVSPLYGVFTPETYALGYILNDYFESNVNTHNYLHPIVQKGAKNTMNITNKTFLSKTLFVPTDVNEQQKIAECFSKVNDSIRNIEIQQNKVNEFKKGLLQQMFVVRINWRCNFKLAKSPSFNKHLLILKNKIIFIIIE